MINAMPVHCNMFTASCKRKYAIRTETGSSKDATILPKPMPVFGNPAVKSSGGMMVPNNETIMPQFKNISKLNGAEIVKKAKLKTMIAPPKSIYKLRCVDEILVATRLEVNMVAVKDVAESIPKTKPRQSIFMRDSIRFVAKNVPKSTTKTAIVF